MPTHRVTALWGKAWTILKTSRCWCHPCETMWSYLIWYSSLQEASTFKRGDTWLRFHYESLDSCPFSLILTGHCSWWWPWPWYFAKNCQEEIRIFVMSQSVRFPPLVHCFLVFSQRDHHGVAGPDCSKTIVLVGTQPFLYAEVTQVKTHRKSMQFWLWGVVAGDCIVVLNMY